MSHMAKYHLGEVTPEDLSAALALGTTTKKGAGGQLSVGTMLSANADEKILQAKVRSGSRSWSRSDKKAQITCSCKG